MTMKMETDSRHFASWEEHRPFQGRKLSAEVQGDMFVCECARKYACVYTCMDGCVCVWCAHYSHV